MVIIPNLSHFKGKNSMFKSFNFEERNENLENPGSRNFCKNVGLSLLRIELKSVPHSTLAVVKALC